MVDGQLVDNLLFLPAGPYYVALLEADTFTWCKPPSKLEDLFYKGVVVSVANEELGVEARDSALTDLLGHLSAWKLA